MTIMHWILIFAGVYIAVGVVMMLFLMQTPYAENPIWTMVLLWPLYLIG